MTAVLCAAAPVHPVQWSLAVPASQVALPVGSVVSDGAIIMVKRVSSRNRRKGHVRPRNVTKRVNKDEKATAEMQIVLGRANPTPAAPSEGRAESG